MSATVRHRQTRTKTEEMSVINPSSLSIPLDASSIQSSEQSTQVVINENPVTDSKTSESTNEKSSNTAGKFLAVVATSVGLTYIYFII
jgi:hypothetical protein